MTINIEEKVKNYEGTNQFIKGLKSGLVKYGRLTPKQYTVAEKLILQDERQKDINVDELSTELKSIVEYKGESKFVLDLQEKFKKYRRLTEKQIQSGYQTVDREIQKNTQRDLNIPLIGETIKLGRNIANDIKEEYNLQFNPILVDVTKVLTISNKAVKFKAKLTKENGGICRCCGKSLTDYMSQITGIGPVCAKYVGVEHPKTKDEVEQFKKDMSDKIDEIGEFEFWIPKRQIVEWNGVAHVILKIK